MPVSTLSLSAFSNLPGFAQYLLDNKLHEFVQEQINCCKALDLSLLKKFEGVTDAQLLEYSLPSATEYLQRLAQNKAEEQIKDSIQQWVADQLPAVKKEDIAAEDITLLTYVRKRVFMHFITGYEKSPEKLVQLINEIDFFLTQSEIAFTQTYINLLRTSIEEQTHFTKQITNTSPGIIYLFNIQTNALTFANERAEEFLGITAGQLIQKGQQALIEFIHPDDLEKTYAELYSLKKAKDGEVRNFEYRLKNPEGQYLWMRNYISVFRRDKDGQPVEIIGNVQNIQTERTATRQLQRKEEQLKEAREIAGLGSFEWNMTTKTGIFSEHFLQIIDGVSFHSMDEFLSRIHPDDRERVDAILTKVLADKQSYEIEYRYLGNEKQKVLWSKGKIFREDECFKIKGTIIDVTERALILEQLRTSEELYKQAQALANVGNWNWDIKNNVLQWSDQLYRIFGIQPQTETLTYEKYFSFVHPDDKALLNSIIHKGLQTGEAWTFPHRITWNDGTVHYINSVGEVVKDRDGVPTRMMGTAQDITQQKEYERQLSEQQRFIQKIADATPSIIAAYNVNSGKYIFINQGLTKLLGYDTTEVLTGGIPFFIEIVHPDDLTPLMQRNEEALQTYNLPENQSSNEFVIEFNYRMKHKNGSWRWFHTYGTIFDRNSHGHIEHILNISLDITERIEAEKKLAEQEYFIKHIADASPTILYLYDVAQNNILYINREIYFVLGYSPEEIIDLGPEVVSSLYHPEDVSLLPERKDSNRHFQQQDSMIQYECRMKHKDGNWCWVLVREVAFKTDESGKVLQVLGAALDINRRKEMERSLLNNSFQLEQSNASLEEFAYVASHDLKEPLRKISTFGDRLITTQLNQLTEDGKIYLKKIVDASQRMQTMISDLLSISMIAGNKSFERHSLQAVLEEVMQTLEYKIEQKKAVIHASALPEANIVLSQFRQLFQNLLSNSLKFVQEERQPEIQISHQTLTPEEVTEYQMAKANTYLKLEFSDNGIGFENEFAGRIFAIFQRLHGRSEYEGTGIGLAICKKIVEHHGGVIYANGVPGKGATFTIILPL